MRGQLAISNGQLAMDYRLAISYFATGLQLTGSQIKFGMTRREFGMTGERAV